MAVVQISRIQARRGLQQDLPQLASAELGWSVDQRRLFIGNGTLTEGAPTEGVTEILTQYTDFASILVNYTFKGLAGGYTAQTGSTLLSPTVRSVNDKLDDFVSVKDFGAVGDGVADDTVAINRAISQIYLTTRISAYPQVRRTIYFPAGTYNITGDVILVPPYARFVGDGTDATVIKQTDATQSCVMKFTDSLYQVGAYYGQNSATLPTNISIEHMTLQHTADKDVLLLDSVKDSTFIGVEFKGSLSNPTTTGSSPYAGVKVASFVTTTEDINFLMCKFTNTRYAVLSDDVSRSIKFNSCYIAGVYKGFKLGENSLPVTTPTNYKITNTTFSSVANRAIDCYNGVTGLLSTGNHFIEVGNNFAGAGNPISTIISFAADGNYSVSDVFDRNDTDNTTYARVNNNRNKSVSLDANVGVTLGTATIGTGSVVTLLDNTPVLTASGINLTLFNPCVVNYSISRGSAVRIGSMIFSNSDGITSYSDNYTRSPSDPGVVLSINNSNVVTYTTTVSGNNATLNYNINHF